MKNTIHKVLTSTRRPDLRFRRDGRIDITATVGRSLDLHPGDVINIAREEGRVTEYYLYVVKRGCEVTGRHEAVCRRSNKSGSHFFRVNCKQLTEYMLSMRGNADEACFRTGPAVEVQGLGLAMPIIYRNMT